MSIALMTDVWKSSLPAGRKMVLLALCDNANDQGECFPSIPMLAQKCSMGERTVQQHITDLEHDGILRRELRSGRSTIYHIDPRRFCTPAKSAPPQNLHPTPAESAPPPPQISHHTPADFAPITTKEPSIESSRNQKGKNSRVEKFDIPNLLMEMGVSGQVAEDWLALRKRQKADPSQTAIRAIKREADAAGITMEDALTLCCARGWRGFKAEWLQPRQQTGPQQALGSPARPILPIEQQIPSLAGPKGKKPDGMGDLKSLVRRYPEPA